LTNPVCRNYKPDSQRILRARDIVLKTGFRPVRICSYGVKPFLLYVIIEFHTIRIPVIGV